jgi:hypothetical protein
MRTNASETINPLNRSFTEDNLNSKGGIETVEAFSNLRREPVWPILVLAFGVFASLTWSTVLGWVVVRMWGL